MLTIANVGVIAILEFFSPTIEAFFIWQASINLLFMIIMRAVAWLIIGNSRSHFFDINYFKRILKFSIGASVISLTGLLMTQLDKIILSKTLGLDNYGKYMLATTLASALFLIIMPLYNTIYPRFSSLIAEKKIDELLQLYRTASHFLATILFPLAMVITLFSELFIRFWTGNVGLSADVAPLLSILVIASALHGISFIPYTLMMAEGDTKSILKINIPLLLIMIPLITILSMRYGLIGGALSQLILFIFHVFLYARIQKKYFKGYAWQWLLKDVGVPLGFTILLGALAYFGLQTLKDDIYLKLFLGVVLWVFTVTLCILSSKLSRFNLICYLIRPSYKV